MIRSNVAPALKNLIYNRFNAALQKHFIDSMLG